LNSRCRLPLFPQGLRRGDFLSEKPLTAPGENDPLLIRGEVPGEKRIRKKIGNDISLKSKLGAGEKTSFL